MSGFEVLGVVLGTIPLVISALEHYQEGLHAFRRWRSYDAELKSLKRSLGNEKAIFVNTCQQLLSGIVNSVELEKLVGEPFGELWSSAQIRDQVALRLDHVHEPFKATVVAMYDALHEIQSKLGLDEQGNRSSSHKVISLKEPLNDRVTNFGHEIRTDVHQVKWIEGKAIARELKRATFTIKRSHFDGLLASISKGNQDLKTLTNQSIQLEPERRVKYHGRLFSQLRDALRSIYGAIRNSLACDCPGAHKVSLRLQKPKLLPRSEESQHLRDSNFHCAVSYRVDNVDPSEMDEIWSLMVLRSYEPPLELPKMTPPEPPDFQKGWTVPGTTTPPSFNISQLGKKIKEVRFSEETICRSETKSMLYSVKTVISASYQTTTAIASLGTVVATAPAREQHFNDPIDLCKLVQRGKSRRSSDCFGFVSNTTSQKYPKFGIYPQPEHEDSTSMISLRTVLEDRDSKFTAISYAVGLKLAIDISSGVLQLINTSWHPERITSQDIIFPTQNGSPLYSQPFFAKGLLGPEPTPSVADQALRLQALRKLMFSLGILLLEIFFETLDHVWDNEMGKRTTKGFGQFSDRKAAADLLNQVERFGSPNFYSAVRRFLFCEFNCLDLSMGDEPFCKEVYGKTIALMEEDFKLTQSLW